MFLISTLGVVSMLLALLLTPIIRDRLGPLGFLDHSDGLRKRHGAAVRAPSPNSAVDTLTHALSGALLARAMPAPAGAVARRVAAGFFACAAPDLDFVASFAGPVEYLLNHRGVTHSLLLMPAWAIGVAWLLAHDLLTRAPLLGQ